MYNVKQDETVSGVLYPGEMNYVWVATDASISTAAHWDAQAPTINLSECTTSQIDTLFA